MLGVIPSLHAFQVVLISLKEHVSAGVLAFHIPNNLPSSGHLRPYTTSMDLCCDILMSGCDHQIITLSTGKCKLCPQCSHLFLHRCHISDHEQAKTTSLDVTGGICPWVLLSNNRVRKKSIHTVNSMDIGFCLFVLFLEDFRHSGILYCSRTLTSVVK